MVTAVFNKDKYARTALGDLWQWDYGQVLQIQGLQLPDAVAVHFASDGMDKAIPAVGVTSGGVTDVIIPDDLLRGPETYDFSIYAYIYITDEHQGRTRYKITIPVKHREQPGTDTPTPSDRSAFDAAVNAVAESAETARDYAEQAGQYKTESQIAAVTAQKAQVEAEDAEKQSKNYADLACESAADAMLAKESSGVNADRAETYAKDAEISASAAREDAMRTASDRIQTGNDAEQTYKNAVQTEEDRQATAKDREATAADREAVTVAAAQIIVDIGNEKTAAVNEINSTGKNQVDAVKSEGNAQISNVQAVVDGIAQESTAQKILENSNSSLPLLEEIARNSGKAGGLNGFGLEKGDRDTVVITYSDPDTGILEGISVFPTDTTLARIDTALSEINKSLKLIALKKGVEI